MRKINKKKMRNAYRVQHVKEDRRKKETDVDMRRRFLIIEKNVGKIFEDSFDIIFREFGKLYHF